MQESGPGRVLPGPGRDRLRVPSIMNEVAMPIRLPVRKPLKLLSCCQLPLTAQQPGLRAGFIFCVAA